MKKSIVIALLLFGIFAQAQKKWTLKECVEHALKNNISIKQSELDLKTTDIEALTALGNFLPSLNANAGVSESIGLGFNPATNQPETVKFLSANGSVNIGYNVFDGLRNIRQVQRAKISKLASQYRLSRMKDDISLLVANSYLNVLLNKANLEVLVSQNNVTKAQIKQTEQLVEVGTLPKGDLLEIKATYASEQQSIVNAENQIKLSLVSLAQVLLIKDYETFDIEDEGYGIVDSVSDKSISDIMTKAKENRSEIRIAEQDVELAKKDVQIANGALLPSLSAFLGYNTRFTNADPRDFINQLYINDGVSYGLSLNIPIFNGFNTRASVKRSKINLERTKFQLEQAELDLESNVYQAYVDAKGTLKAYEAAESALESQELAYEYAKARYDEGLTNAFDFSQAKLRYDNSKINLNRAKYDYIFKLKVLELFFGIPATELKF